MHRLLPRIAVASLDRGAIILLALATAGRDTVAQTTYASPFSIAPDSDTDHEVTIIVADDTATTASTAW